MTFKHSVGILSPRENLNPLLINAYVLDEKITILLQHSIWALKVIRKNSASALMPWICTIYNQILLCGVDYLINRIFLQPKELKLLEQSWKRRLVSGSSRHF